MEWHDAYHKQYGGRCPTPLTPPSSPENDDNDDNDDKFTGEIIDTQSTVWNKFNNAEYPDSCHYQSNYKNIWSAPLDFADQLRHKIITNSTVDGGYFYISFDKLDSFDHHWVKYKIFPVFKHIISPNICLEMKVKCKVPPKASARNHQSSQLALPYKVCYHIKINDNTKNVYDEYKQYKYKQYYSVKVDAINNDDNFSYEYKHFRTGDDAEFSYQHTTYYTYNDLQKLINQPNSNDKFIDFYASGLTFTITTTPGKFAVLQYC